MRGLMWVVAVFALAVGLSLAAHLNDGYAILVFPPYRAELSLNFAILLGLAGFTLGYLYRAWSCPRCACRCMCAISGRAGARPKGAPRCSPRCRPCSRGATVAPKSRPAKRTN